MDLLRWAEKKDEVIVCEKIELEGEEWWPLAMELHGSLVMHVEDEAMPFVTNTVEQNGLEAWRRLVWLALSKKLDVVL